MIAIKNRKMLIPNEERYIGTTFDENSQVLSFKVSRYTQNDIDLSALNAKADVYHCATETEDRADLTMEVQAKYIILHLYITAGMVATPGTVLIDLKLFNDDGEIKWSSYRGAFFVDDPLASPSGETSLTELEQLEIKIRQAIDSAVKSAREFTEDWLEENIGEIEGYVVDGSLSTEGAAADAAEAGKRIKYEDTLSAMTSDSKLIPGMYAVTGGYSSVGDGGGGLYLIRDKESGDEPDGGLLININTTTVAELIHDGTVSVKQFGAKGDGTTDDVLAFRKFYIAVDLYKLAGIIPEGTYIISDSAGRTFVNGLRIVAHPKAIIKAAEGFGSTKMMAFYASDSTDDPGYFTWTGGIIVAENVEYEEGRANDAFTLGSSRPMTSAIIDGLTVTSLEDSLAGLSPSDIDEGQSHGDSLMMIVAPHVRIRNCNFHYARDCAIYLSGDGLTHDVQDCFVDGCHFYGCAAGINSKREHEGLHVTACVFDYCGHGIATASAASGSQTVTGPGKGVIADSNTFKNCDNGIILHNDEGYVVSNNRFVATGTARTSSYPICVYILGCKHGTINGNLFDMREFSSSFPPFGVQFDSYDNVACDGAALTGNIYKSVSGSLNARGIGSETGQTGIVISDEVFVDVPVPVDETRVSGITGIAHIITSGVETQKHYNNGTIIHAGGMLQNGSSVTLYFPEYDYVFPVAVSRGSSIGLILADYWSGNVVIPSGLTGVTATKSAGQRSVTLTNNSGGAIGYRAL